MYLVLIAWLYVALMMAVAEATSNVGSLLGAIVTFMLYGALPISVVAYIMGAPARKRHRKAQAAHAAAQHAQDNLDLAAQPDAGGESSRHTITSVREKV